MQGYIYLIGKILLLIVIAWLVSTYIIGNDSKCDTYQSFALLTLKTLMLYGFSSAGIFWLFNKEFRFATKRIMKIIRLW